jgi:hypothetical protein
MLFDFNKVAQGRETPLVQCNAVGHTADMRNRKVVNLTKIM